MTTIAVIDYGMGNLHSACKGLEFAGATTLVTDNVHDIEHADGVLLPGVGAFDPAMEHLRSRQLIEPICRIARSGKPFLGICVGMQMMATWGFEHGKHKGFDWISGEVRARTPETPYLKIPHMGWNSLEGLAEHPCFDGIATGDHAYFVHSYHLCPEDPALRLASVGYGGEVTAAVGRDNLIGTQFHPEKSQTVGLRFIANFLQWRP